MGRPSDDAAGVGFRRIGQALNGALRMNGTTAPDDRGNRVILRRLGFLFLEMGAMGFIAKLIIMLAVIENPEVILGQFTLGMVPVFYGIYVAAAICFPLANRLKLSYKRDDTSA